MNTYGYQRLGLFAYGMFVLQNSIVAFSGLFLFFIALVIKASGVVSSTPTDTNGLPDLQRALDSLLNLGILGSFALCILGIAVAFIIATIQYFGYKFALHEHEMHIKRGILNTDEITIPYRHIIDIEIERPLIYQILGASILTIYSRTETNAGEGVTDESEGRLPAIRSGYALKLRGELLRLAHEQDIGRNL